MTRASLISSSTIGQPMVARDDITHWMCDQMKSGALKHDVFKEGKERFPTAPQIELVAAYYIALRRYEQPAAGTPGLEIDPDDTMTMPHPLLKLVLAEAGKILASPAV